MSFLGLRLSNTNGVHIGVQSTVKSTKLLLLWMQDRYTNSFQAVGLTIQVRLIKLTLLRPCIVLSFNRLPPDARF